MKHPSILIVLLATLTASTAYAKRKPHTEGKPSPKPCLTSGCSKLTIAYDLSSIGMEIYHATQHQQLYAFERRKLPWPWDSTGYFVMPDDQERNLKDMKDCYDPSQKLTADQLDLLRGIVIQLKQNYYQMPNFYWTVIHAALKPECVNSVSISTYGAVFFYTSLANAVQWDRDAIAAVISHEAGHLADNYCGALGKNITVAAGSTALQQVCEKHADNIGIQYVVGAGFNPNGFVSSFQALQRYKPMTISMRYTATHPINADRIANVGLALKELCKEDIPRVCEDAQLACASGYTRVYTEWDGRQPTKSSCVPNTSVAGLSPDLKCPPGYVHTADADPPHNDTCVLKDAYYAKQSEHK